MFSLFPALLIRKNIVLGLLLGFSVLGGLYVWAGPAATWRLWQVPSGGPPFMDVRVITDGVIAHRKGLDPLRDNVGDVSQRRLNYPRIWQSLYGLGVDESSANAIGLLIVLLFAVGVVLVAPVQTRFRSCRSDRPAGWSGEDCSRAWAWRGSMFHCGP